MTPVHTPDQWMTLAEAARYTGIGKASLRALCELASDHAGYMPHSRRAGRNGTQISMRKSDLDAALLATGVRK